MSRKYRLSTALDVDDLLMECTSYAIRLANEKYRFDPPMTIYEKNQWGKWVPGLIPFIPISPTASFTGPSRSTPAPRNSSAGCPR